MRQTTIVAITALITTIVAIWGTSVIDSPRKASAAPASGAIDVMQMMKDARHLPDQQFSAY
jgi:hypothetical protein